MKRIGIIAALPGELKPLVSGWTRCHGANSTAGSHAASNYVATGRVSHWEYEARDAKWIAACAGIGEAAAARAFAEVEKDGLLAGVLSVGWAGGLQAGFPPGQVSNMAQITDTQTGEQFQLVTSERKLRLLTTARVAGHEEKLRLSAAYPGAALVDMEAATIARLAAARGIPCYCFKAVSDGYQDRLPDLNPFITSSGQFLTGKFVVSIALRPFYWSTLARFGSNSRKAADNLANTVRNFLLQEEYLRDNR